jgi:hypothetical protein
MRARAIAPIVAVVALLTLSGRALAAESPDEVFARAAKSLGEAQEKHGAGAEYGKAIALYESLADRGFVHPDVSFDRGVAYAGRARTKEEEPGDLGRAAAAFEETLLLRPGDHEAEAALDLVRAEVTKRRSRKAKDDIIVRPSLDRLVIGLASEETWSWAAVAASACFAVGLVMRKRPTGFVHVAGSVLAPVSLVVLAGMAPLAFGARWLREHRRPGVVVVPEVSLASEDGKGLGAPPIPEAASVEVGDARGDRVFVRWGSSEGYVPPASVRVLAR